MENRNTTLATWHWHIEVSSKCTLRCPRCPRIENASTLRNTELSAEFFKQHFTPEFIKSKVEKITFCGDDGDPIYARDLIEIIRYIKSIKPVEIVIVTNGSHKKEGWWQKLGSELTDIDEVQFSVDGWDQASNEQYRVNCDWDSIITGITALRNSSSVFITWATIIFSFNEANLDTIRKAAVSLGCDSFQLTKSTKFNKVYSTYPKNDTLAPKDGNISFQGRFSRSSENLTDRVKISNSYATNVRLYQQLTTNPESKDVLPLCLIGNKGLYVSSQGRLYPCCWVANRYNHNNEWQELSIDLHTTLLKDALTNEFWSNRFRNFEWQECKTKCNSAVADLKYCTEW